MSQLLPSPSLLSAFVAASLVLAITPGPGVLYIVMRSAAQGRRSGLASVAGVALGNLGTAVGAALGLGALFAISSAAFTVVKFAGAAYLIFLGLKMLRAQREQVGGAAPSQVSLRRIFRDGLIVALLNPKTALFFAAFLPQFVRSDAPVIPQTLALGALFVAIAAATDSIYALAAGAAASGLQNTGIQRFARIICGAVFIGLGVLAAAAGSRTVK